MGRYPSRVYISVHIYYVCVCVFIYMNNSLGSKTSAASKSAGRQRIIIHYIVSPNTQTGFVKQTFIRAPPPPPYTPKVFRSLFASDTPGSTRWSRPRPVRRQIDLRRTHRTRFVTTNIAPKYSSQQKSNWHRRRPVARSNFREALYIKIILISNICNILRKDKTPLALPPSSYGLASKTTSINIIHK